MMRKEVVFAFVLGSCLGVAAAFAQDKSAGAAAPAATPDTSSAQAPGDDTIHLHMPVHHRATHAHAARKPVESGTPADVPTIDSIGADSAASPIVTPPVPATAQESSPPPAKHSKPSQSPAPHTAPAIPFSFGEDSGTAQPAASRPPGNLRPEAALSSRQTKTTSLPSTPEGPREKPLASKPTKEAGARAIDEHAGLTKRGAVLFSKGLSNPSPQQFDGLKMLAGEISTALESGASRVQLEAYGGAPGDKSSDAHRLSLRRALAVRQILIDDGIPSNRIDVRALGGAEDKGAGDRVDVFVRAS